MSLHRSGAVIGKLHEKEAPVSTARAIEGAQAERSIEEPAPCRLDSVLVSAVLMNWSRYGSIHLGVRTWSRRSPA